MVVLFVLCMLDKSKGVQTIIDNDNLTLDTWLIKDNFLELLQILIIITNFVAFKLFRHIKTITI